MMHMTVNKQKNVWGFKSISFWLASLIAIGIIYIGINGILHPADAAAGFGVPLHNASDLAFVRVKAVRDIVSGLVSIAFLLLRKRREFSILFLVFALIPIGDFLVVLFTGDHQLLHLAIHSGTALYMIIVGSWLYWQSVRYDH
jgi:hypothetical protein